MKKGDIVRNDLGWLGTVLGISTNVRVEWQSGPLRGREGLVPREHLKVAARRKD